MAILNRIRYFTLSGDFAYEVSLVFKDDYSYEQWVINNTDIHNVAVLESHAITEAVGMSIISYEQPIEIGVEEVAEEEVVVKKPRSKKVVEEVVLETNISG